MRVVYKHNGYTLLWNRVEIFDDMGEYSIFDENYIELIHATTKGVPPTEEEAKEILENIPELLKMLANTEIDWDYVKKRNSEIQEMFIQEMFNKDEVER